MLVNAAMTKVRIGGLAALIGLLLAGAIWLALREPPAPENQPPPSPPRRTGNAHPNPHPVAIHPDLAPPEPLIATNPPPPNAADLYRQAFAALEALSKDESGLLSDWKTKAVAPELCAKLKIGRAHV